MSQDEPTSRPSYIELQVMIGDPYKNYMKNLYDKNIHKICHST